MTLNVSMPLYVLSIGAKLSSKEANGGLALLMVRGKSPFDERSTKIWWSCFHSKEQD